MRCLQKRRRLVQGFKKNGSLSGVPMLGHMGLMLLFALSAVSALAQEPLRQQIRAIAGEAHGKVSAKLMLLS
jgi:hypothetical protein